MNISSSIYHKLMKENVGIVNKLLSKLMWFILLIIGIFYLFTRTNILRVESGFIIKWAIMILSVNIGYILLEKLKASDKVQKYYLLIAMQCILVFGGSNVKIGYHILYVIIPVVSCFYFDKKLTMIVSTIGLISMNLCIMYVAEDRVKNVYTTYTKQRYIKANAIGYSIEFIALVVVLWFLVTRIVQVMVNLAEKNQNIVDMQQRIIASFAGLIESRDDDTGQHVKRTERFVEVIIESVMENNIYTDEMDAVNTEIVSRAAQLHDIGKLKISDNILCKPGRLTEEEYEKIKVHTLEGKDIIEKYLEGVEDKEFIEEAKKIALSHHERWDGKGYPEGLKENEIPIGARIMAVADVFDALVSKRCYKEPIEIEKAFVIIEEEAGKQFDPEIVEAFLKKKNKIREIYEEQKTIQSDAQ